MPYCIDLIGGPYLETHDAVCKAFRPKSAVRSTAALNRPPMGALVFRHPHHADLPLQPMRLRFRRSHRSYWHPDALRPLRHGHDGIWHGLYVEKLVERYFSAMREIKALQQPDPARIRAQSGSSAAAAAPNATRNRPCRTSTCTTPACWPRQSSMPHCRQWFAARQIEAQFDYAQVDTSGFFDDAARMVGQGYALFAELMDRVRFAYRKSHSWVNLELASLPQRMRRPSIPCAASSTATPFCPLPLPEAGENRAAHTQTAPAVRQFFDGGWLEWYAFIALIELAQQRGKDFSCTRGEGGIPNEDLHELDVVCLPAGQPRSASNANRASFAVTSTNTCACASAWTGPPSLRDLRRRPHAGTGGRAHGHVRTDVCQPGNAGVPPGHVAVAGACTRANIT